MFLFAGLLLNTLSLAVGHSTVVRGADAGMGVIRWEFLSYGLVLLGAALACVESRGGPILQRRPYRRWLLLYFPLLAWMVFRSALEGVEVLPFLRQTFAYALALSILLGQRERSWLWFRRAAVWGTGIAVLYGLLHIYTVVGPGGGAVVERSVLYYESDVVVYRYLTFGVPFLLFIFPSLTWLERLIAASGFFTTLLFGVIMGSRGIVFHGVLMLGLAFVVWWRAGGVSAALKRGAAAVTVMTAIAVLILGLMSTEVVQENLQRVIYRATHGHGAEGSLLERTLADPRFPEARVVMGLMTWDQWALGGGVRVQWYRWRHQDGTWDGALDKEIAPSAAERRNMVHVGYIHLLFNGGVLFLGLWLYFPVLLGWRCAFFGERDLMTAAAGAVIVYYSFVLFTGYPILEAGLVSLFLSAGRLAAAGRKATPRRSCDERGDAG